MSDAPQPPNGGIYGKVPAFGDFVRRRLPSAFVKPWDEWLSSSISVSRSQIADRWTEAYLTSPPWRFALDPGIAGPDGWIGVLASSVDEVRRCYPITVAIPLPAGVRLFDLCGDLEQIVADLEKIALQLIAGEVTPDAATKTLDELTALLPVRAFLRSALSRGGVERLQTGMTYASIGIMSAHLTQKLGDRDDAPLGISAWWHAGWNAMPAANLVAAGLPSPELFASFLDGSWRERGWADHSSWRT
jgi:type VI secretion system protein ImpM